MALFLRNKKIDGWMAIDFQPDGICIAHVKRPASAMPVVELATFYSTDKATQSATLQKLAKEMRLDRFCCTTVLGTGDYQMLSVDAPNVPPDELKVALRWRLKDMLDFHIDDATIDVLDIPADKNAPVRNHSLYAVVARNQLIQQRQGLFQNARIPLSVIDIPEMAQRNISELATQEGRGLAMLSFSPEGGLLTVTFGGELYLSRRIDVPLSQLLQVDADQRIAAYDRVTLELQRSLDHFDRQYHFIAISRLLLVPIGAEGTELREYLSTNLYLPIEELALDTLLDISRVPNLKQPAEQQRFFMALSAALRLEETTL
jgi:MSHA biogenesis protein MshI